MPEIRHRTYTERLEELNLPPLDLRRTLFDMVQEFKIIGKRTLISTPSSSYLRTVISEVIA